MELDYYDKRPDREMEKLGNHENYQGEDYGMWVGEEIGDVGIDVISDNPIKFKAEGNTIYPISFNISPETMEKVNNQIDLMRVNFPNIEFPAVGLYWRFGTT